MRLVAATVKGLLTACAFPFLFVAGCAYLIGISVQLAWPVRSRPLSLPGEEIKFVRSHITVRGGGTTVLSDDFYRMGHLLDARRASARQLRQAIDSCRERLWLILGDAVRKE